MGYDVFISYSSKDKAAADAVCAALETNGVRCWIAPRNIDPGQDWMEAIIDGIEAAKVMVLVFSQHSNTSDQVKREVSQAASRGLTIVPLRLEDVPMNKRLRYLLSTTHWLDALTPPLEKHLRDFAKKVRGMLQLGGGPIRTPPALAPEAAMGAVGRGPERRVEGPETEVEETRSDRKDRADKKPARTQLDNAATRMKHKAAGSSRVTWNGLGMCEYLRYAGSMGWDKKAVGVVAEKLGFKPSPTTIYIQCKAGRNGEKVPSVDKSMANQLAAWVADVNVELAGDKVMRLQRQSDAKLKELFVADRISADQFQLGRKLLKSEHDQLDEYDSSRRAQFVAVVEGKLAPDDLAAALSAIETQQQAARVACELAAVALANTAPALVPVMTPAVPSATSAASATLAMPPVAPNRGEDFTNTMGMTFVRIEAGSFLMGSPEDEEGRGDNEFQHRVTLTKTFYMATTPVTQKQWKAILGTDPSHFKGDDLPVEQVSWHDAATFCKKLSEMEGKKYRLPTVAEWEYCCRAGTTTAFNTGTTIRTDEANYDGTYTHDGGVNGEYQRKTTPVGLFKPNSWGLFDMHGNVWEWCADGYGEYEHRDEVEDPKGDETSSWRVLRGGSWGNGSQLYRAAYRLSAPDNRFINFGFRVCLDF